MIVLEYYSHASPLKKIHPIEKIVCAIAPLLLNIIFQHVLTSFFIFIVMSALIVIVGKISIYYYVKLLLLPLAFLLSSVFVILWTITRAPINGDILLQLQFGTFYIGVFSESILQAITLFAVAMASVSCLYFLILTTTIQSILYGLKLCKIPDVFLDLIGLTYRFIFVYLDTSKSIFIAQKSRLGTRTFFQFLKSMGLLVSSLFVKVIHHTKELNYSINARSIHGYQMVIDQHYTFKKSSWLLIATIVFSVLFFHFAVGRVV